MKRRLPPVGVPAHGHPGFLPLAAVGAAIQCLNQVNQYIALTIATSDEYARTFGKPGADGLTLLFVGLQHNGYAIDAMFFGLWLAPLGYLVVKSRYFPGLLGVLQIIACAGYLAGLFTGFLAPDLGKTVSTFVTYPAGAAGELPFMLWLLVKGVRVPENGPATAVGPAPPLPPTPAAPTPAGPPVSPVAESPASAAER
jgi:hypothetical protein